MSQTDKPKRTSYKRISEQTRLAIIDRILDQGQSLKEVASAMNVNVSTCKAIIKVYQEEGRIGKKQKRNKVYNVIETFSFIFVKDGEIEQVGDVTIDQSKISYEKGENLDKLLEENARVKAEEMLQKIVENKKKEEADVIQRQMLQYMWMQNNGMMQYYPQMSNAYPSVQTPETVVKQQNQVERAFGSNSPFDSQL